MRKYIDNCKMTGIRYTCSLEKTDKSIRYVVGRVYEYATSHTGNIYTGKRSEKGVIKIGEFFEIDEEVTEVIEEPIFYA